MDGCFISLRNFFALSGMNKKLHETFWGLNCENWLQKYYEKMSVYFVLLYCIYFLYILKEMCHMASKSKN